jgi:hypothetical protein
MAGSFLLTPVSRISQESITPRINKERRGGIAAAYGSRKLRPSVFPRSIGRRVPL